jgi:hypothetical protein
MKLDVRRSSYYDPLVAIAPREDPVFSAVAAILLAMAASVAFGQQTAFAQSARMPEWQIAAGGKMAFEVASIKPSKAFRSPNFPLDPGGRICGGWRPVLCRLSADY